MQVGEFEILLPVAAAHYVTNVKKNNKKMKKDFQPEQKPNNEPLPIDSTSSPNCTKPNVSSSASSHRFDELYSGLVDIAEQKKMFPNMTEENVKFFEKCNATHTAFIQFLNKLPVVDGKVSGNIDDFLIDHPYIQSVKS